MRRSTGHAYEERVSRTSDEEEEDGRLLLTQSTSFGGKGPFCTHRGSCAYVACKTFANAFVKGVAIRGGLSLALHMFSLAQSDPYALFDLNSYSETRLRLRDSAVRLGCAMGLFSCAFTSSKCALERCRGTSDHWNDVAAGALAGAAGGAFRAHHRRTLAFYLLLRWCQCVYNKGKEGGYFGNGIANTVVSHGDVLLFSVSTAQCVYAYVMHARSLPPSYERFMSSLGVARPAALSAFSACARRLPAPLPPLNALRASAALPPLTRALPQHFGCDTLHPHNSSCVSFAYQLFVKIAKHIFPLYASLTFVPMMVFRFYKLVFSPREMIANGLLSSAQSSAFLASCTASCALSLCLLRRLCQRTGWNDRGLWYWLIGLTASSSLYLERKSRRAELALYVAPRALYSLCAAMGLGSHWSDMALMCFSVSGLMYFHVHERHHVAPLVSSLLSIFVPDANPAALLRIPSQ